MNEKFREQWLERQKKVADSPVFPKAETDHLHEDDTRHGHDVILDEEELEEIRLKEKEDKIEVPEILREAYEELEQALEEGEEQNTWEIKGSLLKHPFGSPTESKPQEQPGTFWQKVKNLFRS